MLRKCFTMLLTGVLVIFLIQMVVAADSKRTDVNKQVVTDQMEAEMATYVKTHLEEYQNSAKKHQANVVMGPLADGDTIGFTVRDFTMNTCMGRKIAFDPATGNIHTIFTQWEPTATDPYHEYYNYFDQTTGIWFSDAPIDFNLNGVNTRSGRVLTGPNGEAWVSFHDHSAAPAHRGLLYNDAGPGQYTFTGHEIAEGRFASADYKDGGMTWFSTNDLDGNFEVDRFFVSTDGGSNWTQTTSFLTWPAGDAISNVEIYPHFNPVNGNVGVFYANSAASNLNADEALFWAESADLGENFTITEIYREETILPDNTWHLIENFSQYLSENDENGVVHLVFNGYGFMTDGTDPDSILYPIMDVGYWNSTMSDFSERIILTDSIIGRNEAVTPYMNSNDVGSGNNMGSAFPAIAIGPNNVLAAIWEQGELAPGDTSLVIGTFPDGTPSPAGIYANDLWCAVSSDGGATWSESFYIDGTPAKCDRSPSLAKDIEYDASSGNYYIHYVYMHDPSPGQDLPNAPDQSAAWVYGKYDITPHLPVGIEDGDQNVVTDYALAQNYPNPFNPSTTIAFDLKQSTRVTLEVFNTLGQKVATVVNGKLAAGPHEVKFDASHLASGVYLYQLTTDEVTLTKKMMLLK